jgi:TonB family protein
MPGKPPMKTRHLQRILLLAAALLGPITAVAQFVQQDYVPMKFIQLEPAIYPPSVLPLGITSGEARVAVQVDDTGKLTDSLVVAYSHPAFAEEAASALKTWRFMPAMVHGLPCSATAVLDFRFRAGGVVVDIFTDSVVQMIHFRVVPDALAYKVCSLDQLDRIPTPTKIVKPNYSQEQARRSHLKHLTVEFYIDTEGHVRLPAVSRESIEADKELSAAAVIAVEQWQFEPPVSRGTPVFVRAQQVFNFN